VLLKRLSEAIETETRSVPLSRDSESNNDGATKVGFTAPSVDGQAEPWQPR